MMLIGGGGNGGSSVGGGSGAVTVWYGAAQHVPDSLVVTASSGNDVASTVQYRGANGLNLLLTGNAGNNQNPGAATASNRFATSGFYQSTEGQAGSSVEIAQSNTTFLSGGGPNSSFSGSNYGYQRLAVGNANGFFILQPIIVGGGSKGANQVSGLGCGGGTDGAAAGSPGGRGMVLIASW